MKKIIAFLLCLSVFAAMPFAASAQDNFEISKISENGVLNDDDNVLRIEFSGEYKNSLLNKNNVKITDMNGNAVNVLKTYFNYDENALYITLGECFSDVTEYEITVDKKVFDGEENQSKKFRTSDSFQFIKSIDVNSDGNNYTFSANIEDGGKKCGKLDLVCMVEKDGEIINSAVKRAEYTAFGIYELKVSDVPEGAKLTFFVNLTDDDGNIITIGKREV